MKNGDWLSVRCVCEALKHIKCGMLDAEQSYACKMKVCDIKFVGTEVGVADAASISLKGARCDV